MSWNDLDDGLLQETDDEKEFSLVEGAAVGDPLSENEDTFIGRCHHKNMIRCA